MATSPNEAQVNGLMLIRHRAVGIHARGVALEHDDLSPLHQPVHLFPVER
jgi:hypothetical protein